MSLQETTPAQPQLTAALQRPVIRRQKTFFYGGRDDSPFKRLLIHLTLALASIIALFPVIRAFGVSIRPGNKLVDTTFSLIPANATFITDNAMVDIFNSAGTGSLLLALTIAWLLSGVILLSSTFFYKLLRERGLMAMERLMGMLLVMIAVQMFMNGTRAFLAG